MSLAAVLFASLDATHQRRALAELNRPLSTPLGYVAKTNPRRLFLSCADRDAYDEGYSAHPEKPPEMKAWNGWSGELLTPRIQGYVDAELAEEIRALQREEARIDRVRDEREREDD